MKNLQGDWSGSWTKWPTFPPIEISETNTRDFLWHPFPHMLMTRIHLHGIWTAEVPSGLKSRSWRWHYKGSESLHHGNVIMLSVQNANTTPIEGCNSHEWNPCFHRPALPRQKRHRKGHHDTWKIVPKNCGVWHRLQKGIIFCSAILTTEFPPKPWGKPRFAPSTSGLSKNRLEILKLWPTQVPGSQPIRGHMRNPKRLASDLLLQPAAAELVSGLLAVHHVPLLGAWEAPEHCRNDTQTATKHHSNLFYIETCFEKKGIRYHKIVKTLRPGPCFAQKYLLQLNKSHKNLAMVRF